MKIYDKARWQIEGGINKSAVINHFKFIFDWLDKMNFLSIYGEETKNGIIDESVVLTEEMVNIMGQKFLDKYYDEYIDSIEYGVKEDEKKLKELYLSMNE